MLQNHFKIAYRHLFKKKLFSLINIIGLTVSMTAFVFIVRYVSFEMSFDRFHENHDSIYRIGLYRYVNGELQEGSSKTFPGVRRILKENFPEVESATGFYRTPANTGFLFRFDGKIYNEPGGVLNPDSAFFKVFPSFLKNGDPSTALKEPNNLVIAASVAKKIFGDTDPVGQRIERIDDYDTGMDFVVTGVFNDMPQNSHFHAAFLRHIKDSWPDPEDWKGSIHTYITVSPGTDPDLIATRMNTLLRNLEDENPTIEGTEVFLQPITAIHLSSQFKNELEFNGSKTLVYMLAFIGLIILVMAWINYINLETARFFSRAREMGVRRIIGSEKSQLMLQFFVEYFCLALCAVVVTWMLQYLLLPYFSRLTGIWSGETLSLTPEVWITAAGIFLAGSLVVGTYPALFLLRLNPVAALKGRFGRRTRGSIVRKSLVIVQFTASLVLIAFVLLMDHQLSFMKVTNKKVELESVIALRNPTAYFNQELQFKHNDYKAFENKLLQNPSVKMVASSSAIPGTEIGFSYVDLIKRNMGDPYDPTVFKTLFVDYSFIPAYGLQVIAGQNFPAPVGEGSVVEPWLDKSWTTILLNERAIRHLGFLSPHEAIGEIVYFQLFDDFLKYKIIGVVEDYHHEAIKKDVFPTIFALNYSAFQQVYYSIRLDAGANPQDALTYIQKSWKEVFPEKPFEYFFLDDYYDQQFRSELQSGRIFTLFAGIAIFIAFLGILGMTLFEANARVKEISIRKVLGASISNLIALLSRDHIGILFLSTLISVPLIWFIATEWLSTYPARIEISTEIFLIPAVIIIVMVVLTSCFQTWKATNANPVDHLKHE